MVCIADEVEFGLPTIDQLYGGQLSAGSHERIRRWLDGFYAAERAAGSLAPRINRSITEGWLRRRCREEYLSMGLGGDAIAAEHAACREAADWYRRQGLVTLSRRAEIRAEAAREIAQGIAAMSTRGKRTPADDAVLQILASASPDLRRSAAESLDRQEAHRRRYIERIDRGQVTA